MRTKREEGQFLYHTNCEECGSSDANAVYTTNTYCWACNKSKPLDEIPEEPVKEKPSGIGTKDIIFYEVHGFKERKITKQICEEFNIRAIKNASGAVTHHYYPYTKNGDLAAYKERIVEGKKFRTIGDFKGCELFGQSLFTPGGKRIILTEGEIDALTVAQAHHDKYGKLFPVVSIPNGASGTEPVLKNREYLRSFDEVILMMDNDEPGQAGQREIAKIIGPDRVKIARLQQKDPSDSYLAGGHQAIISAVFEAQSWCPAGIVNSANTWDHYLEEQDAVYTPWPSFVSGLNDKIYGRRLGSITTFTSGTGSGKTSFLREDMFHLLNHTDSKIGICSLEESVAETVRGFISLDLSKRVGIPGVQIPIEEQRESFERTLATGRFEILDHQGSVSDDSLIDKLEYMACTCDYIYLDHITIAVSEVDGSMNAAMDKFMSDLLKLAKRHNVWIGVVSHLRKSQQDQSSYEGGAEINEDSLKGSGSLKQISAQIIALERNKYSDNLLERNTVKVKVLKDRFTGDTGTAARYKFNNENGRLEAVHKDEEAFDYVSD